MKAVLLLAVGLLALSTTGKQKDQIDFAAIDGEFAANVADTTDSGPRIPIPDSEGNFKKGDTCPQCNGSGRSGDSISKCRICEGNGELSNQSQINKANVAYPNGKDDAGAVGKANPFRPTAFLKPGQSQPDQAKPDQAQGSKSRAASCSRCRGSGVRSGGGPVRRIFANRPRLFRRRR